MLRAFASAALLIDIIQRISLLFFIPKSSLPSDRWNFDQKNSEKEAKTISSSRNA